MGQAFARACPQGLEKFWPKAQLTPFNRGAKLKAPSLIGDV